MLNDKEAVIFDLDGTLVDSMWMWKSIDREYLDRFQISLPADLQSQIEGMSFTETAEYFKKRFELKDSIEKIKADWNQLAWDKYMTEVPLKQGVLEFLTHCKQEGLKMGIATSNSVELVTNIAKVHNLDQYIEIIRTSCDVKKGKPAPDIYLLVAQQLKVIPQKCLVFEDIVPGIQAGKAAGMTVCAVEDPYSANQREEKKKLADYYINNYYEILNR
ncbi:MAG: HAD family phosphatase [Lachnospiraceae bacterium]|nr:HAD family phosphatase [Lachnospiraceae bacterium]MDD3660721.1 HAD family phosphatase [Lachnospiraceae bacterium]